MAEATTAYRTHADKRFSYIYMFSNQVFFNIDIKTMGQLPFFVKLLYSTYNKRSQILLIADFTFNCYSKL